MKHSVYLLLFFLLLAAPCFSQTTFSVTTNANDGAGSLRAAITSMNSSTLSGPFTITFTTAGPVSLTAALPTIAKSCTIIGINNTRSVIERSSSAVTNFRIVAFQNGINATIKWLTIQKGYNSGDGGGVFNNGALLIDQCLITGNQTIAGNGGAGIFTASLGSLTVTMTTVSSNTASFYGGGICQLDGGTTWIMNSTIRDNQGQHGGGVGTQGIATPANMVIQNCLIANNRVTDFGGGVGNFATGAPSNLTILNSTISGNSSNNQGGGFDVGNNSGGMSNYIDHCTITQNTSAAGKSAVQTYGPSVTVLVQNSLIAGNTGGSAQVSGSVTSLGHNIISDNSAGFTASGDLKNTNPQLLSLADNGGPTLTHALACNSPAVNAGIAGSTTTDQRGIAYVGIPDIGAFEYQALSIAAANNAILTCTNTSLSLSAIVTGGSNYTFIGPGLTSVGTLSAVTVSQAGTFTITALATGGCTTSTTIAVSSNYTPNPLTISKTGAIGCGPNSVMLTGFSAGATSYTLSPSEVTSSNGQFVVTTVNTYTIISGNGIAGCLQSSTLTINEGTNAVAGAIIASGPASANNPARLTSTSTGQSFVFTGPNGYVFSNAYRTGGTYSVFANDVLIPGLYILTVYGTEGCPPATSSITVN